MIGFIGLGNMGKAMLGTMLRKQLVIPEEVIGSAASKESGERVREQFGIRIADSNRQTAQEAEILFLAVKPVQLPVVLEEIREELEKDADKLVVSIAAGKSIGWYEELLQMPVKLIRCMPNTPALVEEGCTAVCRNRHVTEEELEKVLTILRSFGIAEVVPESLMDVVVGVSGSSPAYVFMFLEAMADAAVKGGMPRAQAYRFAAQSVLGSAKMLLETGMHPGELKDMVCSPGGTTIEAVEMLEKKGFRAAVMEAMDACIEKSGKL